MRSSIEVNSLKINTLSVLGILFFNIWIINDNFRQVFHPRLNPFFEGTKRNSSGADNVIDSIRNVSLISIPSFLFMGLPQRLPLGSRLSHISTLLRHSAQKYVTTF
eukprot:UN03402